MNKMIKGSVAGATGIVLLMGGFGTYALWSDSTTVNNGGLASGRLDIGTPSTARWVDMNPATGVTSEWTATDVMVPGDVVKMTQDIPIQATGKNLSATFTLKGLPVNADWANLNIDATYSGDPLDRSVDDGGTPNDSTDDEYVFTKNFDAAQTDMDGSQELTLMFSFVDTQENSVTSTDQQGESVSLSSLQIQVQQYQNR